MESLKGIYTALLTPFKDNRKINEVALIKLIKHNLDMGVTGFYVCGSTGEALMLNADERMEIMRIVKENAGDARLIAHIGSLNENDAVKLACYAKELSYDLISSVAPFYYKFSFSEIKDYYIRLAEASDMKMLVYHMPAFSGVGMGMNEISSFLCDDRFAGIKYTSNDFFTMERCKALFPDKLIYNGYDEMLLSGLSMGADGAIGSTYNFMADKFVKIHELFKAGNIADAQKLQIKANEIIALLCKVGVMPAEKEVLTLLGYDMGDCRHPFSPLSDEAKKLVKEQIIPLL